MTSNLIITKKRGVHWYFLLAILSIVTITASFLIGRYDGRVERQELISERDLLLSQISEVSKQMVEDQQQRIMLESSAQVEAQASHEIMETISSLQQNIDSLEKELSFYRGIIAPEKDVKGLQVQDVTLEKSATLNGYRFQVALLQAKEHTKYLKGKVTITIEGESDGSVVSHDLLDVSDLKKDDLNFQFKYYQEIKGKITLPEGFIAKKVNVVAKTSGRKSQSAIKSFDWSF